MLWTHTNLGQHCVPAYPPLSLDSYRLPANPVYLRQLPLPLHCSVLRQILDVRSPREQNHIIACVGMHRVSLREKNENTPNALSMYEASWRCFNITNYPVLKLPIVSDLSSSVFSPFILFSLLYSWSASGFRPRPISCKAGYPGFSKSALI